MPFGSILEVYSLYYVQTIHCFRSRHEGVLQKKEFLKISQIIKKRLQHGCFLVKYVKFLRTPILKKICNDCFCYLKHTSSIMAKTAKKIDIRSRLLLL